MGALLWGCAGTNPAAPPAPLAEIPSAIAFPDAAIEVEKISEPPPARLQMLRNMVLKGFVGSGPLANVISQGPETIADVNALLNDFLSIANAASIPVSPELTQLEFAVGPSPDRAAQVLKFDFSPFDFDGDGNVEACTGCSCPVGCAPNVTVCPSQAPLADLQKVCFRVWLQRTPDSAFERFLAGVFDILPVPDNPSTVANEENPGKGTYIAGGVGTTTVNSKPATASLFLRAIYDHRDPSELLHLRTALSNVMKVVDEAQSVLRRSGKNTLVEQVPVDASGDPERVTKTVKTTFESFDNTVDPNETAEHRYIGRFREDLDFWSGSFFAFESPSFLIEVPTTCARISTAEEVSEELCLDAGIDTSQEAPLEPAQDLDFPAAFPPLPTF